MSIQKLQVPSFLDFCPKLAWNPEPNNVLKDTLALVKENGKYRYGSGFKMI